MKMVIPVFLLFASLIPQVFALTIPENAFAQGENWYCQSGFKADRVNNKCLALTVPQNAFAQGENWYCQSGFKADRVNNKCLALTVPQNAFAQGENWYCQSGFKADRVNNKCLAMTNKEKQKQIQQIQAYNLEQRNQTLVFNDEEFTLKNVERKCEVYRYSANYGDLECTGLRFIERKCEAYFSDEDEINGSIECSGSDLRPIERYCTVLMYSDNYGDIDC